MLLLDRTQALARESRALVVFPASWDPYSQTVRGGDPWIGGLLHRLRERLEKFRPLGTCSLASSSVLGRGADGEAVPLDPPFYTPFP